MTTRVVATGSAGDGMLSIRRIEPGEVVFALDRPLLIALDNSKLDSACSNCLACKVTAASLFEPDPLRLQTCAGCHTLRYCSKVRPCYCEISDETSYAVLRAPRNANKCVHNLIRHLHPSNASRRRGSGFTSTNVSCCHASQIVAAFRTLPGLCSR